MADRGRGRGRGGYRGRGSGGRGSGGRGRGRGGGTSGGNVCFDFEKGACKRNPCRYSHDPAEQQSSERAPRPPKAEETEEERHAKRSYDAWKRHLRASPNDPRTMQRLWECAYKILEERDRNRTQQLPKDLDDGEQGREHIAALMSKRAHNIEADQLIASSQKFLLTMTHPSLLDSLAVDAYVGSLLNFMSGANGTRAVPFFQHLCETLIAARTKGHPSISTVVLDETLLALSVALREILKKENRARFNDDLEGLIAALETAAEIFASGAPTTTSILVVSHVRGIRDMVARAKGLLVNTTSISDGEPFQPKSSYPRDLVIPSGRHDNDKLDMTEIFIFPTRDEIMSDAKEFLPFTDPDQPHFLEDPTQRHLDTHFRLLRHDIFGELKGALSGLMHTFFHNPGALSNPHLRLGDVRAYHYTDAHISQVVYHKGLDIHMSFQMPLSVQRKTVAAQRKWLEDSRRLEQGSLLSFIWIQGGMVQHVFLTLVSSNPSGDRNESAADGSGYLRISAQLMTQDKTTLEMLMKASASQSRGILLEFPKIMPSTFVPILENLQSMQRLGGIPFQEWIVPQRHDRAPGTKVYHDIPPPLYARHSGFNFALQGITNSGTDSLLVNSTSSCDDDELLQDIASKTPLDRGQCRALVAALTREFAFIQGPPGTGKSFLGLHLMRVLLGVKKKAKLGPVLVVCYTNHALDQFLEHLIDVGVTKIIRVGGQSKSQALANHNLKYLKKSETNTKAEKSLAWEAYNDLDDHKTNANDVLDDLRRLHKNMAWSNLKSHISDGYPKIHAQFSAVDEEGWQIAGRPPFELWSMTGEPMSRPVAPTNVIVQKATTNIWTLKYDERRALILHWISESHEAKVGDLLDIVDSAAAMQVKLDNVHSESSRRILQEADVIGLTTSGLAGRISLLRHVPCKVLICEEAGEILEPHMISALLPTVEHCIQIGDHEQLRPSVTNYDELSLESEKGKMHQLDKSQFERLSVGEEGRPLVPVAQLNIQRRMRPEVSTLIRQTLYGKLIDHGSTTDLPDVVGMRHNVFWLDHTNLEDAKPVDIQHSKSKTNEWEVRMVHAMVRHIVRQGTYKSIDIAVLTPYTGQLQKLRTVMRDDFEVVLSDRDQEALENEGFELDHSQAADPRVAAAQEHGHKPLEIKQLSELLRVATVDNFQGEEAKVVIVSLVRSNDRQNVGFLKTSNRINVLLSRAKHGMYLIGNTDTYDSVDMWHRVIGMLRSKCSVGKSIDLCCPRHPDKVMQVREPDDFARFSPEGGCREACQDRLDCGHSCESRCHSEAMHAAFQCEEPCQRHHQPCDHPCQKGTCGEPCGKCEIKINNVKLPCGHIHDDVKCHRTVDPASISCNVLTTKEVPGCNHTLTVKCSQNVDTASFRCTNPCKTPLSCSHPCPGSCGRCNGKDKEGNPTIKHQNCTQKCGRKMGTCNHACGRLCHDGSPCGLCQKPCEVRCKHSRCPHKCNEPCAPCVENCGWSCEHQGDCTMPCAAPCNRLPCDERCSEVLPCGHQCPSICGEKCPILCCQECGMKANEQPDMLEMKPYSEIDLNESPILALACGHFFTIETLDGVVSLKDAYKQDPMTGRFVSLIDDAHLAVAVPQCPSCRTPIRQHDTQRYNRIINKAVIDEMTKRFIVSGQQQLQELERKLDKLGNALETTRKSVVPVVTIPHHVPHLADRVLENLRYHMKEVLKTRYDDMRELEQGIKAFRTRTSTHHQPANKLHQATVHATKKHASLDSAFAKLDLKTSPPNAPTSSDQRIKHGGLLLKIKMQCIVLEDKFAIALSAKNKYPADVSPPLVSGSSLGPLAVTFLSDCLQIIAGCTRDSLPKLEIEAILYYSRIAQVLGSSGFIQEEHRANYEKYREKAKALLEEASGLCKLPFKGAAALGEAVEQSLRLLGKEFYEAVTKEEMKAIKRAMVSGPGGIATHSGHWYNCVNGHPFAIGECGMPMEQARCPECGEPVGGQNHTAVAGVTRASNME